MKRIITLLIMMTAAGVHAQSSNLATFEGFGLAPNSYYTSTLSTPFQDGSASFSHNHSGGFWLGGFSYTNKYDTVNGSFSNLYGVRAYKGAGASDTYVVAQDKGVISFGVPQTTVNTLYITNTTYAYKTILTGDQFCRKFGDTTGTGTGSTIAQGQYPDYFKVVIKAYLNGLVKNDSVEFYLADYQGNSDYVVDGWQQVNTAGLGALDSLKFFLRSTDMSFGYINTPGFFAIDNLSYTTPSTVGLLAQTADVWEVYPNPCAGFINVKSAEQGRLRINDLQGNMIYTRMLSESSARIDLSFMPAGVYVLELSSAHGRQVKKLVKE